MLVDFFLHLKARELPVSTQELLALLEALKARLVGPSLDDFYLLARTVLVKDEAHYDRFDRAFAEYFKGLEAMPGGGQLTVRTAMVAPESTTCPPPLSRSAECARLIGDFADA